MESEPVPTPVYLQAGIYRWNCVDGYVIGDTVSSDAGVHFYPKNDPDSPTRQPHETGHRLSDPLQLARAIEAATAFAEGRSAEPHTPSADEPFDFEVLEEAAKSVVIKYNIERAEGESYFYAMCWELGEGVASEKALEEVVRYVRTLPR